MGKADWDSTLLKVVADYVERFIVVVVVISIAIVEMVVMTCM
jgi:hypothetical protein